MTDIRVKIDELIEESYLATLPEEAIRKDVLQFLDTCDKIIATAKDERKREEMHRRLEAFKDLTLRIEKASELADQDDQWTAWSDHDLMAHRAARVKLLVLEAMRSVDQSVVEQIQRQRFPHGVPSHEPIATMIPRNAFPPADRSRFGPASTGALLRATYALLTGAILFIIGYRLFH